jgi:hypothetical protein
MKNFDQIMVTDCILTLENEGAFYKHFWLPYQKNLLKYIKKGNYSKDSAVNGLQERIRVFFKTCDDMQICKYRYKYIPTKYDLSKPERVAVATGLIENFELDNL